MEGVPSTAGAAADRATARAGRAGGRWPYGLAVAVAVVGLVVTAVLAALAQSQYNTTENRLLSLRTRDLGSVLTAALPDIQTPLASAAALADATDGNVQKFTSFMSPYTGTTPGKTFVSASLWRRGELARGPVAIVGEPTVIASSAATRRAFFDGARRGGRLAVIGLGPPRLTALAYIYTTPEASSRYVVVARSALPKNRRSRQQSNSAFADLNYAMYLGRGQHAADLLVTSLARLPVTGTHDVTEIPFGDTVLTLAVTPQGSLAGSLPQRLPLIIAIAGVLLTLGATALTLRLTQRRRGAEELAGRLEEAVEENQRLYAEQRTIAQTLQHALLPKELPRLEGAQASGRYAPSEAGVEIGGDWYDVLELGDHRLLMVVGDVSGHGLPAATTMAALRYAIHAYAAQDDPPAAILDKLSSQLDVATSGHLATVLLTLVDLERREMTVASAGHLPPLLITDGSGAYVESKVGVPIGVRYDAPYIAATLPVPEAATFLAFTDGLVERRGESLDEGLERLRRAALAIDLELPELLSKLMADLRQTPQEDDTAIVGLRWTS